MNREAAIDSLRDICKQLKLVDEDELADKVLCALAAETDAKDPKAHLSYTYVLRKLRKKGDLENIRTFQQSFKDTFERALDEDVEEPDKIALMHAIKTIDFEG